MISRLDMNPEHELSVCRRSLTVSVCFKQSTHQTQVELGGSPHLCVSWRQDNKESQKRQSCWREIRRLSFQVFHPALECGHSEQIETPFYTDDR